MFKFFTPNNLSFNSVGRHPCLWCTIIATQMWLALNDRTELVEPRTLEQLRTTLESFQREANGNIKKAKDYLNVIHKPLLDIPIDQVFLLKFFCCKRKQKSEDAVAIILSQISYQLKTLVQIQCDF